MKYDCWMPEYGDRADGRTVESDYPDIAAQEFVRDWERRNSEYPVATEDAVVEVMVCRPGEPDSTARTYFVTGQITATYCARLKV